MRDLPVKSTHEQITAMKWNFVVQMLYHPLIGSIRASIIMFLFRMKDNRRRVRHSLHIVFWLNVFYAVATSLGNILQCSPVRYIWEKPAMDHKDASGHVIKGGHCFNSRTFVLLSCALSIFMDLIIIPIPSIMVWNLQMTPRTKFLVIILMSLGWIATSVSVGRLVVYYYRFSPKTTDRTWNTGITISIAEPCVHVITACAPATKFLFRSLFPSFAADATPTHREEQLSTQTPKTSKFGSKASHGTADFQFSLSSNHPEDTFALKSDIESTRGTPKEDNNVQDLDPLPSRSSRAYIGGHTGGPRTKKRRTSLDVPKSPRTSCSRTACTETSEEDKVEQEHCFGQIV